MKFSVRLSWIFLESESSENVWVGRKCNKTFIFAQAVFSYYCFSLMLRGCCATRDSTLSLEGEWYETLICISHPSVAFQVSSDCWASYLSKICIANVFFCFLSLLFCGNFLSREEFWLEHKQEFLYNVYGVDFSYFVLAGEVIITLVLAAL